MQLIKNINIGLRFILELCLVTAMAYVGFKISDLTWLRWVASVSLVVVTVLIWGYFIAPKAEHLLQQPFRLLVEVVLFGVAIGGLYIVGQTRLSLLFGAIVAINEILLTLWKQ